ncbi:MAG: type II secretion system protein [Planctomycetota bacterium]|nr:MAG: type II secretion system protein [Planctomycetota bacterium]
MIRPRPRAGLRAGFTLLEMMVVILIIGILSTYLIVNVPEWTDKAKLSACEANMRRAYQYMVSWQADHDGQWPKDEGSRFWLRLWKDGQFERTASHAKMFFCPSEPYQDFDLDDETVIDYLNDWDALTDGAVSYAGFTTGGDRQLRAALRKHPGKTAILADGHFTHRTALVYMTADGVAHRLLRSEVEEQLGIDLDVDDVFPGPGCEIEVLRTVSTD